MTDCASFLGRGREGAYMPKERPLDDVLPGKKAHSEALAYAPAPEAVG